MSKQLFEFVKVAAGEPFPFESGEFCFNFTGKLNSVLAHRTFIKDGVHVGLPFYILRPAESPDAGSCPTCKNEGKVQSTGPTWAYELCPSCKGSRTFQQPMPTTVGIASPDAGSEGLENPYPESVFPTLNEAQIAIAVKALELAGIGADRYAGNIGRLVWDQAAKALTTTANVGDIPAGREAQVKQASADYVRRNKLGVSTIGMRSGFEHGAAWAFSRFPTPADPGSQVEAGYTEEQVREAIRLARASELKKSVGQSSWANTHTTDEIIKQLNP